MELIVDTETTGLPKLAGQKRKRGNDYPPPEDLEAYSNSRIVSIAWIVIDSKTKQIVNQQYHLIKPDNFTISEDSIKIHHITQEFASDYGMDLPSVLDAFGRSIKQCDAILAYNLAFDFNIIKSELIRYEKKEIVNDLDTKQKNCIMMLSKNHMEAPFYPKLADAYRYIFHTPIKNAHNAMGDVLSCYEIYKSI